MKFWEERPILFQSFISLLSFIFVLLGTYSFLYQISRIDDENIYNNTPSSVYISSLDTNSIKGKLKDYYDSLLVGKFVTKVNGIDLYRGTNDNGYTKFIDELKSLRSQSVKLEVIGLKVDTTFRNTVRTDTTNFTIGYSDLKLFDFKDLTSSIYISYVYPDGVSDRAGIKKGDIVTSINGSSFDNIAEADSLLKASSPNDRITYRILRDTQQKIISLRLPKFGINFSQIIVLLVGIFIIFLGEIIGLKRSRIAGARVTSLSLIFLGLLLVLIVFNPENIKGDWLFILFSFEILIVHFAVALLTHSFSYFPTKNTLFINKKWITVTPYIIAFIASTIYILALFQKLPSFLLDFRVDILSYGVYIYIFILIAFLMLSQLIYRSKIDRNIIRRGRWIKSAYVINVLAVLLQVVLINLEYYKLTEFTFVFLFLIPLSYIFTISRYRVFELNLRVRRNYQYILVSSGAYLVSAAILIFSIYLLSLISWNLPNLHFTGTSIEVLKSPLRPEMHDIYEKIIIVLISFLFALIIWNITKVVQEKIDNKFYRSKFDFRRAASELGEVTNGNFEPELFTKLFLDKVLSIIKLKRVGVILFKENKIASQRYFGFNDETLQEYCRAISNKLITSMKSYSDTIPIDYLPDDIRIILNEFKFRFITPIWSKQNIVGLIFIGEKLSETSFQNDDLLFLTSIANQTSIAFENSLLYEDLAKQERYKHELEIARNIQLASLPQKTPDYPELDISGVSIPALEVGGDFYDFFNGKEDELTVIIGDVSGKGTSAALYMSKIQGILRTLNEFKLSPKELLIRTNQLLFGNIDKKSFITSLIFTVQLKKKIAKFSRAGHLPLYFYNSNTSKAEKIQPKGIIMGMDSGNTFNNILEEVEIKLNKGNVFVLITDGITEARNNLDQEFEDDRIIDILERYNGGTSEEIKNAILSSVQSFMGESKQFDDMTIVVVKMNN